MHSLVIPDRFSCNLFLLPAANRLERSTEAQQRRSFWKAPAAVALREIMTDLERHYKYMMKDLEDE